MDNKYELIFTILNRGFSDLVMDSARANGATGGTIITARGTGAAQLKKLFGLTISQEKEIIIILTAKEMKNEIMSAICKSAGLNTQGKGITFSLPVDDVLGVSLGINSPKKEDGIPSNNQPDTKIETTENKKTKSETTENKVSQSNEEVPLNPIITNE